MLEWVLSASILTLIVIGLRFLLRGKLGLRLQYALWALVLVRLLLPFSIGSSAFSAGNLTAAVAEQTVTEQTAATPAQRTQTPVTPAQNTSGSVAPIASPAQQPATILPQTAAAQQTAAPLSVGEVVRMVWLAGIGLVGLFFLSINLRFYVQVKRTRRALTVAGCRQRVYVTDAVDTPCLFGLLRPAIYVTPTVAEDATLLRHTIAHEQTHLRHGDAYWSILRGLCLALHWYNPLVWWAAFLSRRDSELACDEATVKRLGESERTAYGRTLIDMTCQKRTALLVTATTMTGSKSGLRERITLLTKKPKTASITLLAVLLLAALAVGCTFTGAKEAQNNKPSAAQVAAPEQENEAHLKLVEEGQFYKIYQNTEAETGQYTMAYELLAKDGTIVLREQTRTDPQITMESDTLLSVCVSYGTGTTGTRYYQTEQNYLSKEYRQVIAFCGQTAAYLSYEDSMQSRGVVVEDVLTGEVLMQQQLDFSEDVMPISGADFSEDGKTLELLYYAGEDRQQTRVFLRTDTQALINTMITGSQRYPLDSRISAEVAREDVSNAEKGELLEDAIAQWEGLIACCQTKLEDYAQSYVKPQSGTVDEDFLAQLKQQQEDWALYREQTLASAQAIWTEQTDHGSTAYFSVLWRDYNLCRERALVLYQQCLDWHIDIETENLPENL